MMACACTSLLEKSGRPKRTASGTASGRLVLMPPKDTNASVLVERGSPGASAAVFVNGIQVAVGGDQQKPLLLSTSPVSMIALEPTEVRQQVISKPAAAGGGATALYKVAPFDGGVGGDDTKDDLETTSLE